MGFAVANTNGASFVFNNLQAISYGNINANTNGVQTIPNVEQLEPQAAAAMAGRGPGGAAYRQPSNVAMNSNTNANASIVQLDAMVTNVGFLPYKKNGAFVVALSGTTNSVVPLTNTQTNTNSYAGDTAFATWDMIQFYNLSGLDGNNAASIFCGSYTTNGLSLGIGVNATVNTQLYPGIIVQGGGNRVIIENNNAGTVNAANANLIFTPTANSTIGVVVSSNS